MLGGRIVAPIVYARRMKIARHALSALVAIALALILVPISPAAGGDCENACDSKRTSCDNSCTEKKYICTAKCGVPFTPGYDKCTEKCADEASNCGLQCRVEHEGCKLKCKVVK